MEVEMTGPSNGCAECGIPFLFPTGHFNTRKTNGQMIYCPNGHPLRINNPEKAQAKTKVELLEARVKVLQEWVRKAGHLITCEVTPSSPCTCGYTDMLETP